MKAILLILAILAITVSNAQSKDTLAAKPDPSKKLEKVEVSCGTCHFEMKGSECALAIRLDGKSYFVDGTKLDDHGDAHAKDGFCETIRKAEVQGEMVGNRYKVTYFKLLPKKGE